MTTVARPTSSPSYGDEMTQQPFNSTSRRQSSSASPSSLWRKLTTRLKRVGRNDNHQLQQSSPRQAKAEQVPTQHESSHPIGRILRLRALRSSVADEPRTDTWEDNHIPTGPPSSECSESETAHEACFSTADRHSVQCDGTGETLGSSASRPRSARGPANTSGRDGCCSSSARTSHNININICGDSLALEKKSKTLVLIATVTSDDQACSAVSSRSINTNPIATHGTTATTQSADSQQQQQQPEGPVTLRDVLMRKVVTSQTRRLHDSNNQNASSNTVTATMTPEKEGALTPLQTRELLKAMDAVAKKTETPKDSSSTTATTTTEAVVGHITTCTICAQPKVRAPPTTTSTKTLTGTSASITGDNRGDHTAYLAEIASRCPSLDTATLQTINAIAHDQGSRTDCCRSYICQICLSGEILRGIRETWWQNISAGGAGSWLSCPVPTCEATLTRCSGTVRAMLRSMTPEEGERCMRMYATAERLRAALQGLTPVPTDKEIRRGLVMHKKLVKLGCAAPLLEELAPPTKEESQQDSSLSSGEEREDVNVKRVTVHLPVRGRDVDGHVETETRRVHLPLFTHTLRLPRLEKECVICAETYHDFAPNCISLNVNRANAGYEASQTGWAAAVKRFPGGWTQQIYDFPEAGTLEGCSNSSLSTATATTAEIEEQQQACRTCLATHIDTQLTLLGPRVAEHGITLPTPCSRPDCHEDHKFGFDQIRRLASPETFARYDRLVTLAAVCHEDGFRWCLRPGCESGAVYYGVGVVDKPLPELPLSTIRVRDGLSYRQRLVSDTAAVKVTSSRPPVPPPRTSSAMHHRRHRTTSEYSPPSSSSRIRISDDTTDSKSSRISCHACDFAMCYHCQTPWHASLTCAQAATQKLHGDPQPQRTRDWLDTHTKRCPGEGCGIRVEKGEGCFHMSCSSCSAQFCWECLADWDGIVVDGRFRREGHREGCYFRGEKAVPPTQIMGRTVERGLRRAGGLRR